MPQKCIFHLNSPKMGKNTSGNEMSTFNRINKNKRGVYGENERD